VDYVLILHDAEAEIRGKGVDITKSSQLLAVMSAESLLLPVV
jgi:hypothetical protein